jgi:predicted enzyme related to lactoylglutathione lyase
MKRFVVTWRKGLLIASMVFVFALALWAAPTATHHQHRALEQADMAFEAVHMTARDPVRLAGFYTQVFGMPTAPRRANLALPGAVAPIVLQLPGYEGAGPVLTLASVAGDTATDRAARGPLPVYDRGYAHICFEADDVHRVVQAIQAHGGTVLSRFDDLAAAAVVYAADPEGNAIEVHIPLPEPVTPWTLARTLVSGLRTYFKRPAAEPGPLRFLHVNLNVADWQRTVAFYQQVVGGEPTGIERNYRGDFIANLTSVVGAEVHGRHVALPGYSPGGPTFEVFTYNHAPTVGPLGLDDLGRVATGFRVRDLNAAVARFTVAGGVVERRLDADRVLVQDGDGNRLVLRQQVL